jgi:serpin B
VHQSVLDLSEKGVEAAAGTAVMMATGPEPTQHIEVHVDRPFVVVLSEGESRTPLFMAVVRDPR